MTPDHPSYRVEVFWLASGQPRPYADNIKEANLVFSRWWKSTKGWIQSPPQAPTENDARALAKVLVRHFDDAASPQGLAPYLKTCELSAPDTWHVVIIEPNCD